MKLLFNIFRIIITIYLLILAYCFAKLYVEKSVYKYDFPTIYDGYTYLEVASGSMEPTLKTGDIIIVQKTNDVKVNDIIIYKTEDGLSFVTHRLTNIDGYNFTTKGDANNTSEQIISDQVVGKVVYYNDNFCKALKILLNPIYIVIIGVVGIFLPELLFNKVK